MDQNHYLSNIDSLGIETIVYNLKYAIEHSSHAEYLETLEMQVKQKNDDIEKICTVNWQEFLENFKKFIIHKRLLTNFSSKVDLFNERIYKISLRNKYDSSEIINKKKAIDNINKTLKHLAEVTEIFSLLNKSISNLSNEKFMASIRTISQIKKKPLLGPQNSTSFMKHVVNEISPMIFYKIRTKSDSFMNDWIMYTMAKQLEVGLTIVAFYEEGFRSNLSSFNGTLIPTNTVQMLTKQGISLLNNAIVANTLQFFLEMKDFKSGAFSVKNAQSPAADYFAQAWHEGLG